jgi:hypothetical protein
MSTLSNLLQPNGLNLYIGSVQSNQVTLPSFVIVTAEGVNTTQIITLQYMVSGGLIIYYNGATGTTSSQTTTGFKLGSNSTTFNLTGFPEIKGDVNNTYLFSVPVVINGIVKNVTLSVKKISSTQISISFVNIGDNGVTGTTTCTFGVLGFSCWIPLE